MNYKPEIDGLRIVAVGLVLLCHMQLGVPGGFIGVDIFFVISGFLITGILVNAIAAGKFSFWNFYGKRFIRLYPALIAVTLLTFAAAFLLTDPVTFKNMGSSGRYAITSLSNIYFNNRQGYFDVSAQKQIFLHTWSLAVEWQFYLLWPFLIWLIYKIPFTHTRFTARFWVIVLLTIITVASTIASQWAITNGRASSAYYLMHYRAFELGIGGLLVFVYSTPIKPATGVGLVVAGIAAIIYAAFAFTPETTIPGFNALIPCLGIAACILGGKAFSKGNVFRWAPVVYMGKTSYSAYLVHWPLLVLYLYYVYRPLQLSEKIALLIASLLLGIIMYELVEKRINFKRLAKFKNGPRFANITMLVLVLGIMFPTFYQISRKGDGWSWRIADSNPIKNPDFFLNWGHGDFPDSYPLGQQSQPENTHTIAVLAGDSFAAAYSAGIDEYLKHHTPQPSTIQRLTSPACSITFLDVDTSPVCKATSQAALQTVQTQNIPLIIGQAWGGPLALQHMQGSSENPQIEKEYFEFIAENLNDIQKRIGDRPLIILGSVPYRQWGSSEQECLLRPNYFPQVCAQELPDYPISSSPVYSTNQFLATYVQNKRDTDAWPVYYIDSSLAACPNGICSAERNSILYRDGYHMSQYGSVLISGAIMPEIEKILRDWADNKP